MVSMFRLGRLETVRGGVWPEPDDDDDEGGIGRDRTGMMDGKVLSVTHHSASQLTNLWNVSIEATAML